MKALLLFWLVIGALAAGGCRNKINLDANGIPGKLVIAHYGTDDPGALKSAFKPYQDYFEKKLGMEVEFITTSDYTAVIEALRARKAHIAFLSPFSYVLASQKHNHSNAEQLSFMPVQDSLYDGIRKIASGIKDLNVFK